MFDNPDSYTLLLGGTALLALIWVVLKVKAARRKPRIHPRLQKYAGPDAEFAQKRRAEAGNILATSSTEKIAGYDIKEQVEAVYVDGFRRPEEAVEGLKAVAAMKGANAVINLKHERTAAGKCSANGDAVVVLKQRK